MNLPLSKEKLEELVRVNKQQDWDNLVIQSQLAIDLAKENQRLKEAIQSTLGHISSLSNPKYCTIERIDLITDRLKQALEGGKECEGRLMEVERRRR